jgi:hypothetical protein
MHTEYWWRKPLKATTWKTKKETEGYFQDESYGHEWRGCEVAQGRVQWQAFILAVLNLRAVMILSKLKV